MPAQQQVAAVDVEGGHHVERARVKHSGRPLVLAVAIEQTRHEVPKVRPPGQLPGMDVPIHPKPRLALARTGGEVGELDDPKRSASAALADLVDPRQSGILVSEVTQLLAYLVI